MSGPRDRIGPDAPAAHDAWIERLIRIAGERPASPPERAARVKAAAHAEWVAATTAHTRRQRRNASAGLIAMAAAAAFVMLVVRPGSQRDGAPPPTAVAATVVALRGSVATSSEATPGSATLRPGSQVREGDWIRTAPRAAVALELGTGASLRVAEDTVVQLKSASLVQLERGLLYFDSGTSRATGAPGESLDSSGTRASWITIRTPLGALQDAGTQFEALFAPNELRVRVREGLVQIQSDASTRLVARGNELVKRQDGSVTTRGIATYGPEWAWAGAAGPPYVLSGRTLGEFLVWLERETGYEVVFTDAALADAARSITLQGSLEGVAAGDAPAIVFPAAGVNYEIVDGTLRLRRAAGAQ